MLVKQALRLGLIAAISVTGQSSASGELVIALRTPPRTFNPVVAADEPSRTVIRLLNSTLVRLNPLTQRLEPGLAERWSVRSGGRRIRVILRPGLKFSDGTLCTSEDVLFSLRAYLDERAGSPAREQLMPAGKAVEVAALDARTVELRLSEPYAIGERLLDGLAILPSQRLSDAARTGAWEKAYTASAPPGSIVGAGPYRLKHYEPGVRVTLERNPHYWRAPLPRIGEVNLQYVANEDAQVVGLLSGRFHLLPAVSGANFELLKTKGQGALQLLDGGPGLDSTFLLFNLQRAAVPEAALRREISAAADRTSIARLAYRGAASPVCGPVSAANTAWRNPRLPCPTASSNARKPATLTVLLNASNQQHAQTAAILQEDARRLGITLNLAPLKYRSFIERLLRTRDFDAALMSTRSGDSDPTGDLNFWVSTGATHLFNLKGPAAPWEAEIDGLMQSLLTTMDAAKRRSAFHRVQEIADREMPAVYLVNPHSLAAAAGGVANLRLAPLSAAPALWNLEEVEWKPKPSAR